MALVACPICGGKRVTAPLGFIEYKCTKCSGIGFVTQEQPQVVFHVEQEEKPKVVIKTKAKRNLVKAASITNTQSLAYEIANQQSA